MYIINYDFKSVDNIELLYLILNRDTFITSINNIL